VHAAVQDVHHRHGQEVRCSGACQFAEVDVQRLAAGGCRGSCCGHGDSQQGVRAEPALGRRSVQRDQAAVEGTLIEGLSPESLGDLGVDVTDGGLDAFPEVPVRIAVAQFERFALAGRGAGRDRRAPERRSRPEVDFNCWIAAGIENLPCVYARDLHGGYV
jgi:hypothetical protein